MGPGLSAFPPATPERCQGQSGEAPAISPCIAKLQRLLPQSACLPACPPRSCLSVPNSVCFLSAPGSFFLLALGGRSPFPKWWLV